MSARGNWALLEHSPDFILPPNLKLADFWWNDCLQSSLFHSHFIILVNLYSVDYCIVLNDTSNINKNKNKRKKLMAFIKLRSAFFC